jgi:uncharacterized membrane protein YraQ (UPF0718 family)
MQVMKSVWDFFQNQILAMKWLNELIGGGLSALGLDTANRWVGSVQFFVYDVVKITVLLCFLIFLVSYIQSYFPPERSKKEYWAVSWYGSHSVAALLGTVNTVFVPVPPSAVHRFTRRSAAGGNLFLS